VFAAPFPTTKQQNMTNEIINQSVYRQLKTYHQPSSVFAPIPARIAARLDAAQAARLLGFAEHDIPVLVAAKLLKPLARPMPNAVKHFASCDLDALAQNPKWLDAATQCVYEHWRRMNLQKAARRGQVASVVQQ
jgi:hypothetical protein